MLNVSSADVFYGDLQVLWDVSFDVKEGEVVALIGANGAGKTTTLKTISGLVRPSKGEITFNGLDLTSIPAHKVIELGVVHVPEGRRLFPEMSVRENLIMGSLAAGPKSHRAENIERVFGIYPRLKERHKQLAGTLSGGEQQMLAIGRGLMAMPKLIMFDEPSLGLAPILVQDIFNTIETIKREGVTILIVEQNVKHTLHLADRAYVLENGRVVLSGTGRDLLENEHVKSAYLGI